MELPRGGAQVRSWGVLQMQVPDFTALSASMLGGNWPSLLLEVFQIPRNFYCQHGRPLDCRSFFSNRRIFHRALAQQWHHWSQATLPLTYSSATDSWSYTEHIIRETVSVFCLWFYYSSKLQRWLPMATGCGKHTLRNISKLLTPYWSSRSQPSNIKMKMSWELT